MKWKIRPDKSGWTCADWTVTHNRIADDWGVNYNGKPIRVGEVMLTFWSRRHAQLVVEAMIQGLVQQP
jgi:hypothetical protein